MADAARSVSGLLQVVSDCHGLLSALDGAERSKAIKMLLLAFDEVVDLTHTGKSAGGSTTPLRNEADTAQTTERFNRRSQNWMKKHGLTESIVERVLDVDGDHGLIAQLPNGSKREQAIACYLLTGVQAMLRTGDAKFADYDAAGLCKTEGCYDQANHATTRAQLGKRVTGDKETGFTLTALGLEQVAALLKKMASE